MMQSLQRGLSCMNFSLLDIAFWLVLLPPLVVPSLDMIIWCFCLIHGALGIPAFRQLTGMNSILFYAPVIFQSLGFGSNASLYSSLITSLLLVVVATLVSMFLVDRLGWRVFFLQAGVQMLTSMLILAIILALKFGHGVVKPYAITLVLLICAFVAAYGWSWDSLGWLVPSELFPLEMRSAGQSLVVSVNLFFTAAVAQFFLVSLCHLEYGIFLLFAFLIIPECEE